MSAQAEFGMKYMRADHVERYLNDLTDEIVNETNCKDDKYNIGKVVLKALEKCPQKINQIDAANGREETNGELRARVLACARALNALGLKTGDVLAVIGRNHIDLCVPYIAGLVSGVAVLPLDPDLTSYELKNLIGIANPGVVFCDSDKIPTISGVIEELSMSSVVVAFPHGSIDRIESIQKFDEFLAAHVHEDPSFVLPTFNTEDTVAMLICTSGTTGMPKQVKLTHYNLLLQFPFVWLDFKKFPEPTRMVLNVASIHWITAFSNIVHCAIWNVPRVQTSAETTGEHVFYIINKYKPSCSAFAPSFGNMLLKNPIMKECDLSSFEMVYIIGAAAGKELLINLRERLPNGQCWGGYGATESSGAILFHGADTPVTSVGKPLQILKYKLIDSCGNEIFESHKPGELLVKGGCIFKGYYRNQAATKEAFTPDGFFKTGDLFYRDEEYNYFFVERLKMLIKYKNIQISPQETEHVIMTHQGVAEAAVCGIPHEEDGEHPAACVVRSVCDPPVTAQEIKDLVKEMLSPNNQLRGGVIFLEDLPLTNSGKVDRKKIKEIVNKAIRE